MSTTDHYDYDYAFAIVQKLPPEDRQRLAQSLQTDEPAGPKPKRKMTREEYYEFLMDGPVLSEEEIQRMEDAKKQVDRCRQRSF